jgi:hypothetical protein
MLARDLARLSVDLGLHLMRQRQSRQQLAIGLEEQSTQLCGPVAEYAGLLGQESLSEVGVPTGKAAEPGFRL